MTRDDFIRSILIISIGVLAAFCFVAFGQKRSANIHHTVWTSTYWTVTADGIKHEVEIGFRDDGMVLWRAGEAK